MPTISDRLAALGFGHRRDNQSEKDNRRVIYVADTGKIVGRFDVFEAIKFLNASPAARELWLDIHE